MGEMRIECDVCDEVAFRGGEITERTLEDEGWYLGEISVLCPRHNDEFLAGETLNLKGTEA